jgi:hypothetical protein
MKALVGTIVLLFLFLLALMSQYDKESRHSSQTAPDKSGAPVYYQKNNSPARISR